MEADEFVREQIEESTSWGGLVVPSLWWHQHANRASHRARSRAPLACVRRAGIAPHLRQAQDPVHCGANVIPCNGKVPPTVVDVVLSQARLQRISGACRAWSAERRCAERKARSLAGTDFPLRAHVR